MEVLIFCHKLYILPAITIFELNNYGKARDRLKMCLSDLMRSLARYKEEDYSDAIFRLQLSVENACKSILSFLGVEFEKTHFPSVIIGRLISDKERLKKPIFLPTIWLINSLF